ncbi:MAG: hypothetical protein ACI4V3_06145 [Faecousia sp.]
MEQTTPKGASFLKVTGILMIIGGGISLIVAIIALLGIAALAALGASSGMLYAAGALTLVSAVAELVTGIIGVANAKRADKAGMCMAWGIVVAVLCVAGCILTVAGGDAFPVFSLILGLVLPVLFIIGAAKNKQG